MENEEYLDIKEGLSVGTMKIANKYEIFTEEEIDAINNKIPELDDRVGVIEDEIEEINTSLDNMESEKATKSEVDFERKRIDNLAKLEEGSTTGDAELIDGRIGVNGKIYNNIGESIRTQNKILDEKINAKTNYIADIEGVEFTWELGKYNDSGTTGANDSTARTRKKLINGILELNISNANDYLTPKVFLYDENGVFSRAIDIKTEFIIEHNGYIAFQTYRVRYPNLSSYLETIKKDFEFRLYKSKIKNIETSMKKLTDIINNANEKVTIKTKITNGKYTLNGYGKDDNTKFFSTNKLNLESGSIIQLTDNMYLKVELAYFNADGKCSTIITLNDENKIIKETGVYAIQGYISTLLDLTDDDINSITNDITIFATSEKGFVPSNTENINKVIAHIPSVKGDLLSSEISNLDYYKYPLTPTWGHEYLTSWYKKIYEGGDGTKVSIALAGDSITEGYDSLYPNINDAFKDMRGRWIRKIMKVGGFPLENLNVVNTGHGGKTTNEFVGNETSNAGSNFPNGYLSNAMGNVTKPFTPHLLIIAYGMNDANRDFSTKTIEERLKIYENNMIEALERIRGNKDVNGRPSYNKPLSELSIIICNPTVANIRNTGRANDIWFQHIRIINQKLCRKYHCAFADLTMRTFDHLADGSNNWATLNADGTQGNIHPNKWADANIFSTLQDLIYPIGLWSVDID